MISTVVVAAADALVQAWPEVERDTELGQALRDNATRLTGHYPELVWDPVGHPVLFRAGRSLGECGLVKRRRLLLDGHGRQAGKVVGPDHPHTLATQTNLVRWRKQLITTCGRSESAQRPFHRHGMWPSMLVAMLLPSRGSQPPPAAVADEF